VSFLDAFNRAGLDRLAHLMTAHHRLAVFDEAPVEGRVANVEGWRGYLKSFPNYVIHPQRLTVNGTAVAIRGRPPARTSLCPTQRSAVSPSSGWRESRMACSPPGNSSRTRRNVGTMLGLS
jgi:hypothetical protein